MFGIHFIVLPQYYTDDKSSSQNIVEKCSLNSTISDDIHDFANRSKSIFGNKHTLYPIDAALTIDIKPPPSRQTTIYILILLGDDSILVAKWFY